MRKLITLTVALLALGCATGYQSSDDGVTGGYSETRLSPDSWHVLVEGNGFTERREVEDILMRRAAELTLEQGKRYFVLRDHQAWINTQRTSRHSVSTSPANEAIVIAVDEKTRDAFDAALVVEETDAIAKGRLSPKAKETLASLGS